MGPTSRTRFARGLSLVELMVALVVGLLLTAGAISVFLSNKSTHEVTSGLSRLQENARFALETMLRDLRMAGGVGCVDNVGSVSNIAMTAGDPRGVLWDLGVPESLPGAEPGVRLEGLDNVQPGTSLWSAWASPSVTKGSPEDTSRIIAGTDAVTVRYLGGLGQSAEGTVASLSVEGTPLVVAEGYAGVVDCTAGVLFKVSQASGTAVTTASPKYASASRYFQTTATNDFYPRLFPLHAARYYVGVGSGGPGHRSLYRQTLRWEDRNGNGAHDPGEVFVVDDELASGVEDMQILYGIASGDAPEEYVGAGAQKLDTPEEWRSVVSVRLGLLLRTVDEQGAQPDTRVYDVFSGGSFASLDKCAKGSGCVDPPDLRVRRRVFTTTVYLRNRT